MSSEENNKTRGTVAVYMITYNHEKYIAQAIEGAVNQVTDFEFKIFIGEDCSKDKTRQICMDYQLKYPGLVEVISTAENNIKQNIENVWKACIDYGPKYIACCEGDDYWIDNNKLQKQYDCLEANPGCSVCITGVKVVNSETGLEWLPVLWPEITKDEITIHDIILSDQHLLPSPTLMFRNIIPLHKPKFYMQAMSTDIALAIMLGHAGNVKYLPDVTAVYRNHGGGISKSGKHLREANDALMRLYERANEYYNYKYNKTIRRRLFEMSKVNLIYRARDKKGIARLKHYFRRIRDYIKYSEKINYKELGYYHLILFFPSLLKKFKKETD
jgi:glycosyltransferase involved in cell wall biosynthesis